MNIVSTAETTHTPCTTSHERVQQQHPSEQRYPTGTTRLASCTWYQVSLSFQQTHRAAAKTKTQETSTLPDSNQAGGDARWHRYLGCGGRNVLSGHEPHSDSASLPFQFGNLGINFLPEETDVVTSTPPPSASPPFPATSSSPPPPQTTLLAYSEQQ